MFKCSDFNTWRERDEQGECIPDWATPESQLLLESVLADGSISSCYLLTVIFYHFYSINVVITLAKYN